MSRRCPECHTDHQPRCPDRTANLRWPIEPLLTAARCTTTHDLADLLHVGRNTTAHAAVNGCTDRQADHWAAKLGWPAALLWPHWCDGMLSALDEMHLAGGWRQAWEWSESSTVDGLDDEREVA